MNIVNNKTITILLTINKDLEDKEKSIELLNAQKDKLKFLNPKTVFIDTIKSIQDYSLFCVNRLTDYFDTDFVLIIQHDGKILNPSAFSFDFFQYDYIGAPWQHTNWLKGKIQKTKRDINDNDLYIGNGGFSLRSKRLCDYLSKNSSEYIIVNDYIDNEDVFICITKRNELEKHGFRFAPYELAKQFSVERDVYNGQFGAHKWIIKDNKKIDLRKII